MHVSERTVVGPGKTSRCAFVQQPWLGRCISRIAARPSPARLPNATRSTPLFERARRAERLYLTKRGPDGHKSRSRDDKAGSCHVNYWIRCLQTAGDPRARSPTARPPLEKSTWSTLSEFCSPVPFYLTLSISLLLFVLSQSPFLSVSRLLSAVSSFIFFFFHNAKSTT